MGKSVTRNSVSRELSVILDYVMPRRAVYQEKLTVAQLVKKFLYFYETQSVSTVLISVRKYIHKLYVSFHTQQIFSTILGYFKLILQKS
jgi:hypothetical protein